MNKARFSFLLPQRVFRTNAAAPLQEPVNTPVSIYVSGNSIKLIHYPPLA